MCVIIVGSTYTAGLICTVKRQCYINRPSNIDSFSCLDTCPETCTYEPFVLSFVVAFVVIFVIQIFHK